MSRTDLLSLSADDLAALTNRGTVKRAQKELESGQLACHISEAPSGEVTFHWSDGVACRFPAGKTIHEAVCSSGLSGISRHIVRSVLAYQRAAARSPDHTRSEETKPQSDTASAAGDSSPAATVTPFASAWDPGQFNDEALIACFKKPAVTKARMRFDQGVLVELTRGAKPVARFLDEACTVRFTVPGDLRYATADCAEIHWPVWISMAVWAFRQLPVEKTAGLLSLQLISAPVPGAALAELQALLDELCRDGVSGVADSWPQRMLRHEQRLRDAGLVWPAELALELAQQQEMYRRHDARFDSDQLVLVLGELVARMRAIGRGTTATPQPLIRGSKSDRPTEVGGGRYIGVGLDVRFGRLHTTLSAFLHDANTGNVVAIERSFSLADPKSHAQARPIDDLAAASLLRGVSIGGLATSQLLLQSGKRTASGQLILPRAASNVMVNPQDFSFEQLKPPLAAEDFSQIQARLRFLPPSYLRPRRSTENLQGVVLEGAEQVQFDVARQQLTAVLRDARQGTARLLHPFHSRAAAGFGSLASTLEKRAAQVRFVCGRVQATSQGLVVRPTLVIFDDGSRRIGLNPWVAMRAQNEPANGESAAAASLEMRESPSPVQQFLEELQQSLAELLLTGVARNAAAQQIVAERAEQSRRIGFVNLAAATDRLAGALAERSQKLNWSPAQAIGHFQQLCLMTRIAAE
jgi:hypothetical protein